MRTPSIALAATLLAAALLPAQAQTVFKLGHVLASNVYVHTPLGWRMVLHHASPGMVHDAGGGLLQQHHAREQHEHDRQGQRGEEDA